MRAISIFSLCYFFLVTAALGVTVEGQDFAETHKADEQTLVLNGIGLRRATFLKVKVYAAAFYATRKTTSAEEVLKAQTPSRVELVFLRSVSAIDMAEAWRESFTKNCTADCERLKPGVEQVIELLKDRKKGERMAYVFFPDRVRVELDGVVVGGVGGKGLSPALLGSWFGPHPADEGLKEAFLGAPR